MKLRRREFLAGAAATGAVATQVLAADAGPYPRIAISSNSFRLMFVGGQLDMLRYAGFVKSQLKLTNLELISTGFAATDDAYCRRVAQSIRDEGCRLINVLHTDAKIQPISPDPAVRQGSLDALKRWMDTCALMGSPSFRTNSSFAPPGAEPDALARIVASYKILADYGQTIGVKLLVENHIGFQSVIDNAIAVIKGVNSPNCRGIVDWGNSPAKTDAERVADCQKMMPYVDLVSAKGNAFDENYRHTAYDQAALVRAEEVFGYRGRYSIDLADTKDPVLAARAMIATIQSNLRA